MMPARAAAARALAAVLGGRSLDAAIADARASVDADDGPLVQELAYGGARFWHRFEPILASRLRRPLKARDADLRALLVIALYELAEMRTPTHAAVDAAVWSVAGLGKDWARGLVNGILRAALREPATLTPPVDPARAHGWPAWLAEAIASDWPDAWPAIAAAGSERPPMTLRVNALHGDREAFRLRLAAAGIVAEPHAYAASALVLAQPLAVDRLPGFAEGDVSVQDTAAQLAAPLLAPVEGLRVLDACAAPGGKTGHLAEIGPPAELVAVERDADRCERLRAGLDRLQVDARVLHADAAMPSEWWGGRRFDRILLDVPCSGTGVIRRHPDIRLLRRPDDIDALAVDQDRLLNAMWPLLAPGGMLLYVTCSVLRRENAECVSRFLVREPGAVPVHIDAAWGRVDGPGRQILPGEAGMDGFFLACLRHARR